MLYYNDNDGMLAQSFTNNEAWVLGDMSNPGQVGNSDLLRQGTLFPYAPNTLTYHCPTDQGVRICGKVTPTVRSYSMSSFMGGRPEGTGPIPKTIAGFVPFFAKDSDILQPSQLWVLIEEDERSINDGMFVTDPTSGVWIDLPAVSRDRHNYSYSLAFADGHAEIWGVRDPRTLKVSRGMTEQAGNTDLRRLGFSATLRK